MYVDIVYVYEYIVVNVYIQFINTNCMLTFNMPYI